MSEEMIFCARCAAFHAGVGAIDADGWPVLTWVGRSHDPDDLLRRRLLDAIVDEAAAAFATAMTRGHYEIAGAFAAEVLGKDPEETP